MGRIFISHSSRDNEWAIRVRDWLKENGWDDIFLDLDPVRGIAAGERWKAALQKAAHRCEVVSSRRHGSRHPGARPRPTRRG